ncbi:Uncharacterised protein [Streptococcus pneumoniae]|nr:Uncharacterised protein [Streptococcus pneumoniae]CKG46961.1 Uncharacterised protein [Streptococcus pneumoniae]
MAIKGKFVPPDDHAEFIVTCVLVPSGVTKFGGFASTTAVVTAVSNPPDQTSNAKSTTAVVGTIVVDGFNSAHEPSSVQSFVVPPNVFGSVDEGTPPKVVSVFNVISAL